MFILKLSRVSERINPSEVEAGIFKDNWVATTAAIA